MNKGCFHEIYNKFGTYADVNGDIGVRSPLLNSVTDCFISANIGTTIGRPDGKSDKYIYKDQLIDITTSCVEDNESTQEVRSRLVNEDGVSDEVGMVQVTQTTTGTVNTLEVDDKLNYQVGMVLQIWNGTTPYRRTITAVNGTTLTLDSTIVKTAVPFLIGGGKLPILSCGQSLSTDVIGQPW